MTQPAATAPGETTEQTAAHAPRRGPGRPRHTDTEPRAFQAVLELFGQRGWAGLSLDAVASHAGIGKSSIYLRWKTKRDLLLDAIRDFEAKHVAPEDDQPLRDYLIAYGRSRGELLIGEHGPTMLNIVSAAAVNPEEFNEIREESISRGVLTLAGRLERAVADGELPPGTDTGQLLDTLEGALIFHLLIAPGRVTRDELAAGLEDYVTSLVDALLRGLS